MAQNPEPPNSSPPFLPPQPPPGPRGLPRPTPIGLLVVVVALVLVLAAIGLVVLIMNYPSAQRVPTAIPRTVAAGRSVTPSGTVPVAQQTGNPVLVTGTGTAPGPATAAAAGVPTANPPPVATQVAGGRATATPGAAASNVSTDSTAVPAVSVVPPTAARAPLSPAEQVYVGTFQAQQVVWRNGMIALNVEVGNAAPTDPSWQQNMRTTTGQILGLTAQALALQAPPSLAAVDARYKEAARHYALAMQLFQAWGASRNPQYGQEFNAEMRQGNSDLQASAGALAAFVANPGVPPLLPTQLPTPPAPVIPPTGAPTTPATGVPPTKVPPTAAIPPAGVPPTKPVPLPPVIGPTKPIPPPVTGTGTPGSSSSS